MVIKFSWYDGKTGWCITPDSQTPMRLWHEIRWHESPLLNIPKILNFLEQITQDQNRTVAGGERW